jgi:hypothetical protein
MTLETLLIGLVLALLWAEITDVSPGGIIVPGYFALYLRQPLRLAAPAALHVVGLIVPGILASSLSRQKVLPTLASLATVATLTFAVAGLVALL